MMRLFVALEPSPEFRNALSVLQDSLRAAGVSGRYLDPSGLHLTLAFIGMWPENVAALLPHVQQPFDVTLSGIGVFPKADVLWAGVMSSGHLDDLARSVRTSLAEAGIPFDPKGFNPHITLVRKPRMPKDAVLSGFRVPPAQMIVRDVCLYRSERGENGMEYTVIGRSGQ